MTRYLAAISFCLFVQLESFGLSCAYFQTTFDTLSRGVVEVKKCSGYTDEPNCSFDTVYASQLLADLVDSLKNHRFSFLGEVSTDGSADSPGEFFVSVHHWYSGKQHENKLFYLSGSPPIWVDDWGTLQNQIFFGFTDSLYDHHSLGFYPRAYCQTEPGGFRLIGNKIVNRNYPGVSASLDDLIPLTTGSNPAIAFEKKVIQTPGLLYNDQGRLRSLRTLLGQKTSNYNN